MEGGRNETREAIELERLSTRAGVRISARARDSARESAIERERGERARKGAPQGEEEAARGTMKTYGHEKRLKVVD